MNIKDAGQRIGLPPKTIRYYEDIGLVTPDRATNGYRDFSEAHVQKRFDLGENSTTTAFREIPEALSII